MATTNLTAANFNQTITDNEIVLIDFWASWCGPCRAFAPIYERVSEKNPDVVFAKVDTEAEQELAANFQIRSIPTVMAVKKGVMVFNQPGSLPQDALEDILAQVKELDIDAEMAKQQANESTQA